jgi:membrane protein implicated in regulation of membrane protease activity
LPLLAAAALVLTLALAAAATALLALLAALLLALALAAATAALLALLVLLLVRHGTSSLCNPRKARVTTEKRQRRGGFPRCAGAKDLAANRLILMEEPNAG